MFGCSINTTIKTIQEYCLEMTIGHNYMLTSILLFKDVSHLLLYS